MREKVMIYDFDGTLTKRKIPLYPGIFKTCFSSKTSLLNTLSVLSRNAKNFNSDFCLNYYNFLFEFLNRFENSKENLFCDADKLEFNPGVISFFKSIKEKEDVKAYVLTSGLEEYVKRTKIQPYVNGVYGTKYEIENGVIKPTFILTGDKKPEIIKKLMENNNGEIIYVGDGMTDAKAFDYVKTCGGKTILVGQRKKEINTAIDYYCDADFTKGSKLYKRLIER